MRYTSHSGMWLVRITCGGDAFNSSIQGTEAGSSVSWRTVASIQWATITQEHLLQLLTASYKLIPTVLCSSQLSRTLLFVADRDHCRKPPLVRYESSWFGGVQPPLTHLQHSPHTDGTGTKTSAVKLDLLEMVGKPHQCGCVNKTITATRIHML